jgi:DNA-directed RNA polymerase sigma subunit (sigma70/sigma32)
VPREEVARELGITVEEVAEIEEGALDKLRKGCEAARRVYHAILRRHPEMEPAHA